MSAAALVTTVQAGTVPSNRQSLVEVAACPHSYGVQVIEGHQMPGGLQSVRGLEIHRVMSRYIAHCVARKVPADWGEFDRLALGAGQEAATILDGLRDNYLVDYEHVYDTEFSLSSDEGNAAGTLDVLLKLSRTKAKIEDFKSHPRPFEPNTDQAMRYSFLVFENFPSVEEVEFELVFVRYSRCRRSVTFTRTEDYLKLRQQMLNSRKRQEEIHAAYDAGKPLPALPGNHCQYCPLLQRPNGCPIGNFNPNTSATPEQWGRRLVLLKQQEAVAKRVLKDAIDASGLPVELQDGNGRVTRIGFKDHDSTQFPLLPTVQALFRHRDAFPEDVEWIEKLFVSSTKLKSYLKAKKRAITDLDIKENVAVTVSKPKFGISAPKEQDDEEEVEEWEELA
jgi:hypothetical protein